MNRKPKIPLDLQTTSNTAMAKLTVKNVGPIRDAELEVKKHTVFIGPQGTGKSTLAKLILMVSDQYIFPNMGVLLVDDQYGLPQFDRDKTSFQYLDTNYSILYKNTSEVISPVITNGNEHLYKLITERYNDSNVEMSQIWNKKSNFLEAKNTVDRNDKYKSEFFNFLSYLILYSSSYIPAERTLISLLSDKVWGIMASGAELPNSITNFGFSFENARNSLGNLSIPYLDIRYVYESNSNNVFYNEHNSLSLSKSASGYQSVIPLLLVVENQRQQAQHRFIIEEPELNLYPTAQKDLIYSLIGGLQPDVAYKDAEWVITTHSPYVLSSFNTLMLAYKVAQRSEELRAEVEKIIPARCWINPDEFAAYYVDNGTVRSIISEKTGLIADNELDDVSEDLAGEQDQLIELSRSVSRA